MSSHAQQNTSPSLRLRLLSKMQDGAPITKGELRICLNVQEGQLREVITPLREAGWLEDVGLTDRRAKLIALTEAGQRGAAEELRGQAQTGGDAQVNMWRTARRLKDFSATDLVAWSSTEETPVDHKAARRFCELLLRGGYVRVTRKAKPGVNEAFYRMIRDTGPRAPVEKRVRAIYDPNEERLTHVAGVSQ